VNRILFCDKYNLSASNLSDVTYKLRAAAKCVTSEL